MRFLSDIFETLFYSFWRNFLRTLKNLSNNVTVPKYVWGSSMKLSPLKLDGRDPCLPRQTIPLFFFPFPFSLRLCRFFLFAVSWETGERGTCLDRHAAILGGGGGKSEGIFPAWSSVILHQRVIGKFLFPGNESGILLCSQKALSKLEPRLDGGTSKETQRSGEEEKEKRGWDFFLGKEEFQQSFEIRRKRKGRTYTTRREKTLCNLSYNASKSYCGKKCTCLHCDFSCRWEPHISLD